MKINFLSENFVDYQGNSHTVTVCMLNIYNIFSLGWSCSNPKDTYDENAAKVIAQERAYPKWKKLSSDICDIDFEKSNNIIQVSRPGFALENFEEFSKDILSTYLKYLIKHPAVMIKGYNHEAGKYKEKIKAYDTLSKMTPEEIKNMKSLATTSPEEIEANKKLYKYYEQIK